MGSKNNALPQNLTSAVSVLLLSYHWLSSSSCPPREVKCQRGCVCSARTSPLGKEGQVCSENTSTSVSLYLCRENRPFTSWSITQCICDKGQITAPQSTQRFWVGPTYRMWPVTAGGEDKAWALSKRHTIDSFQSFPFFFWLGNKSPNSDDRQWPILRAEGKQYIGFLERAAFWECNIDHLSAFRLED